MYNNNVDNIKVQVFIVKSNMNSFKYIVKFTNDLYFLELKFGYFIFKII